MDEDVVEAMVVVGVIAVDEAAGVVVVDEVVDLTAVGDMIAAGEVVEEEVGK